MFNYEIVFAGMPGGWEMVVIALVILLMFGAKKLPELAKGLGQGIREFKGAVDGIASCNEMDPLLMVEKSKK